MIRKFAAIAGLVIAAVVVAVVVLYYTGVDFR